MKNRLLDLKHAIPIKRPTKEVEDAIFTNTLSSQGLQEILTLYQNRAQSTINYALRLAHQGIPLDGLENLIPIHIAARSILRATQGMTRQDYQNIQRFLKVYDHSRGRGEPLHLNLTPSAMGLGLVGLLANSSNRPISRRNFGLGFIAAALLGATTGCDPGQGNGGDNGNNKVTVKVNWYVQTASGVQATSTVEATPGASNSLSIGSSPLANDVNPNYIAIREKGFVNGGLIGKLMGNNAFGRNGTATYDLPSGVTEIDAMVLDKTVANTGVEKTNEYYGKLVNGGLLGRHIIGKLKTSGNGFVNCAGDYYTVPFHSIDEGLRWYNNLGSVKIGGVNDTADVHFGCKTGQGSSKSYDPPEVWINSALGDLIKPRYFTEELFEWLTRCPDLGVGTSAEVICDPSQHVLNQTGIDLLNTAYFMKDLFE